MLSVEEASSIVLNHLYQPEIEAVPLAQAVGRILKEELVADRDFPPFNRVAMDGIAIRFADYEAGARVFPIEGVCPAGTAQKTLQHQGNCLEVMTGCVLPKDADTVIRYEDVDVADGKAKLLDNLLIQKGKNIHQQGLDRKKGTKIVATGRRISTAEIGVAATIGKTHLQVATLPKIVVISTGNELVPVGEKPLPHQIRRSNVHSICTIAHQLGIQADSFHLPDDKESIQEKMAEFLREYDAILLSGGVSKGKFDFLPEVFEELGVIKLFHRLKQRPGKPFWFGQAPNKTLVFAFPGNPVSTVVCTLKYFRPWLEKSLGLQASRPKYVRLASAIHFKPKLTCFLPLRTHFDEQGAFWGERIVAHGSGDLASLVEADGFVMLPGEEGDDFQKGEAFPFLGFR